MGAFFTAVLAKFAALATWIGALVKAVFVAAWLFGTDLVCWIFEGFLKLLGTILSALPGTDAFAALNPAQYINGLPADFINVIGLIRIGEALAIILTAIGIKLTLQLIPFTRLGS